MTPVQLYWLVERFPKDSRYQYPAKRHLNYDEACDEAKRLAELEHVPFVILAAVKVADPTVTVSVDFVNPCFDFELQRSQTEGIGVVRQVEGACDCNQCRARRGEVTR